MKKLLTLLFLLCSMSVFADINNKDAVTMENFEQRWLDHESTIALKNNTNETIHNVSYRITYLDMNGKALDYSDYTSTIDIEPGMVKKADIPAYEHKRFYQYYKNAEKYVLSFIAPAVEEAFSDGVKDYKTQLQEKFQKKTKIFRYDSINR